MSTILKRAASSAAAIGAAASLVISLFVIVQIWRFRTPVTASVDKGLGQISETLQTTADGVTLVGDSLETALQSMQAIESTLDTLTNAISDTTPLFNELQIMVGDDLPQTIDAAQSSLKTAEASAHIIDQFLRAITFLNPNAYDPEVPLDEAIAQVSSSLNPLSRSFSEIDTRLGKTSQNLASIQDQTEQITASIQAVNDDLVQAQAITRQYQGIIASIQPVVGKARSNLPQFSRVTAWMLTFIFTWLGIAQIELLLASLRMARAEQPPQSNRL